MKQDDPDEHEPDPDQFDIEFDPAAHTRSGDPETSHEAGAAANASIKEACRHVYEAMKLCGPAIDEDLQRFYDFLAIERGWKAQRCVRKRRKDLVDGGYAKWTGERVLNPVGRHCRVWAVIQ